MSQAQQKIAAEKIVPENITDWHVDSKAKSVRHRSGLIVQLSKGGTSRKPASLEILWIEKLIGTPWANRSNLLIEAGILLLKAL